MGLDRETLDRVVGKKAMDRAVKVGITATSFLGLALAGCFQPAPGGDTLPSTRINPAVTDTLPTATNLSAVDVFNIYGTTVALKDQDLTSSAKTLSDERASSTAIVSTLLTPKPSDTLTPSVTPTPTPSQNGTMTEVANMQGTATKNSFDNEVSRTPAGEATQKALATRQALINMALSAEAPTDTETPVPTATLTPSETDTATPTNTVTPSSTPSAVPTEVLVVQGGMSAERLGQNAIDIAKAAQGSTLEPMATPGIATPEQIVISTQVYSGEAPASDARTSDNPMREILKIAAESYQKKYQLIGNTFGVNIDGFMDNLTNPTTNGFSPDKKITGGLGFQSEDIIAIEDNITLDLLKVGDRKVSSLVHHNIETDLYTFGFTGKDNEKSATAYLAAMAALYIEGNGLITDDTTIKEAHDNLALKAPLTIEEEIIIASIQEEYEGLSKEEAVRRSTGDKEDANNYIPAEDQKPDQFLSCDNHFVDATDRQDQIQGARGVLYRVGGPTNFRHQNITEVDGNPSSHILIAGSGSRYSHQITVGSFTDRGFNGNENTQNELFADQMDSAVGQRQYPCFTPATIIPTDTATFVIPNTFTPFETPKPGDTPVPAYTLVIPNDPGSAPTETQGVGVQTLMPTTPLPATEAPATPLPAPTQAPVIPTPNGN